MNCPHCNKEVYGGCHDVDDLYEEPKELTSEEQIKRLRAGLEYIDNHLREFHFMAHFETEDIIEDALKKIIYAKT